MLDVFGAGVAPQTLMGSFESVFLVRRDGLGCLARVGRFQQFKHAHGYGWIAANGLEGEVFLEAKLMPAVDGVRVTPLRQVGCRNHQVGADGRSGFDGLRSLPSQRMDGSNKVNVAPVGGGGGIEGGNCDVSIRARP